MKTKVGIIGGAGYTGGEILRLLLHHPMVELSFIHSKSQAGKAITEVHTDLLGECDLHFSGTLGDAEVLFLCAGHGESQKFLAENPAYANKKIVDLSSDFREQKEGFVYGLPEWQAERIAQAQRIANPGCFATAINLAMLPLAQAKKIQGDVHVSAITGSTGAGQALSPSSHFTWRNNNLSIYKAFNHQHLTEIGMVLGGPKLHFIPYRGNFTRGILATVYTPYEDRLEEAMDLYESAYASAKFVHLSPRAIDLKQVVNTNKALLHLEVHQGMLLITSIIDNLLKGASGQALQNLNLMMGWPEDLGLRLKPIAF